GTQTLTGTNTYAGATLISGTLKLTGTGSIADSFLVEDNGLFDISGTTHGASIHQLGGSGTVKLGGETLTLTAATSTSAVFFGVITGAGGLTLASGTEVLAGVNTYSGTTTIDPGALLVLAGPGSIANSAVDDDGLLLIAFASKGAAIRDLAGSGLVELGGKTLTITQGAHTFGGVIDGSGGLTIAGGSEGLSGTNSYTGATLIDAGATLKLVGAGSIADSAVVTDNGGVDISGASGGVSIRSLAGGGDVALGANGLTLAHAAHTFSGDISGSGGLTVAAGTETLSGTNDYTGLTTIDGGAVLALSGAGSIAQSSVEDDGVLDVSGAASGASIQSLAGAGLVTLQANSLTLIHAAGTFAGVISGSGGFAVAGGTEILTSAETYTGDTGIGSGATLKLTGAASISGSAVDDDGTFDVSGASGGVSIVSLAGSGGVALGGNGLTLTAADGDFSGMISGSGGLTVAGGGEVLSGTNAFTGPVAIDPGAALQLGAGASTGSVISAIVDNGTLIFDLGKALTYGAVISGTGSMIVTGAGPITLTADQTYTGGTAIGSGATLKLGAGGTSGGVLGDIVDDGALVFNRSDDVVFSGTISGTGDLTQAGPGTLVLDGVNGVSGLTTVAAGTLEVGDAGHTGAVLDSHLGGVLVDAGATLRGHGTIVGAVTNDGVVAPGGSIGTLTVGAYTQGSGGALNIEVSPTTASRLRVIGAANLAGTLNLSFDAGSYAPQVYTIITASSVSGTFATVNRSGNPAGMVYGVGYGAGSVLLVGEPTANAQVYGEISKATLDRAQSFAGMVEDSFGEAVCASGANAPHGDDCNGMRAWAKVIGSSDHANATSSGFAFTNKGAGALGGIEKGWGGATLGAAFGYTENNLRINGADASASGRSYYLAAYGRWSSGPLQLDGQGFWMKTDWPLHRMVQGVGTAGSNPDGDSEGFLVQASTPLGASGLRPYVRFTYAHFGRDASSEDGVGVLGFDVQGASAEAAVGEAGLIYDPASVDLGHARVFPTLRLGIQQDFSSRAIPISATLGGLAGTQFTTSYVKAGRTTGVADAAIKARLTPSFDLTADVRGRLGSGQSEAAGSIGGVIHF
ncbi:MAG TPA: autotransporter domain-containing protein, partial [Caulobacteraceae bacterium]